MNTKHPLLVLALVAAAAAAPAPEVDDLHFALRASEPAADASVISPEQITLTFTEIPQENSVAIRLIDASEETVDTGEPTYDEEDRRVIHMLVGDMLAAGPYTVAWRAIGSDGHVVRDEFNFEVTTPQ